VSRHGEAEHNSQGDWGIRDPSLTQNGWKQVIFRTRSTLEVNLKSISHKCYLFEVAFVWELTEETIVLPLGCLQGGDDPFCSSLLHLEPYTLHAGPHTPLPTR